MQVLPKVFLGKGSATAEVSDLEKNPNTHVPLLEQADS